MLVDIDNKNEWRDCFDVSGVELPTGLYFGASAATGQLAGVYKMLNIFRDCACHCYDIVKLTLKRSPFFVEKKTEMEKQDCPRQLSRKEMERESNCFV